MNYQWSKLLNPHYLFSTNPSTSFPLFIPLIIIFSIVLLISLGLNYYLVPRKKEAYYKKFYHTVGQNLFWFSLTGFFLTASRKTGIPLLRTRIFLYVIFGVIIFQALYWIYWRKFLFPSLRQQYIKNQKKLKYR